MPLGAEIPLERTHQRGVPPLRNRYFTTIGSSSVKTVAYRRRLAAYHKKEALPTSFSVVGYGTDIDDLERPRTPKYGFLVNF